MGTGKCHNFNILQLADNRPAEEEHDLGTGEGRQLQVREGLGVLHQHVQETGSGQLFIFEGWFLIFSFPGPQLDSCGEVGAFEHFRC